MKNINVQDNKLSFSERKITSLSGIVHYCVTTYIIGSFSSFKFFIKIINDHKFKYLATNLIHKQILLYYIIHDCFSSCSLKIKKYIFFFFNNNM